jgi:hypothetical protein
MNYRKYQHQLDFCLWAFTCHDASKCLATDSHLAICRSLAKALRGLTQLPIAREHKIWERGLAIVDLPALTYCL